VIRYAFIHDKVLNIYRSLPTVTFPININQILSTMPNCRIMSYQKFAQINQCTLKHIVLINSSYDKALLNILNKCSP